MSNINKTIVRTDTLTLDTLDKAVKSGVVLSVLIAPDSIKFFCTMAVVQFPGMPQDKQRAVAVALRNRSVPFCSADRTLGGTLQSIPPAHLEGKPVVAKVYGPAQPATRPVVKPGAPAPEAAKPAEEPVKLAQTADGELAPAPKKEKKARAPRAPRASRAKKAKGGEQAAS